MNIRSCSPVFEPSVFQILTHSSCLPAAMLLTDETLQTSSKDGKRDTERQAETRARRMHGECNACHFALSPDEIQACEAADCRSGTCLVNSPVDEAPLDGG